MPLFTKTPGNFYVAHNATIVGDVRIGELASFWFNAVVRGDEATITIGRRVNVQDAVVIHSDSGVDNVIEDDVTIGHGAIVHGTFVGQGSLIGMGSTLLSRTRIGRGCLIAAGAVVPPGLEVPDGMVVMGVPGKVVRPVKDEDVKYMRWLTERYVELAQNHVDGKYASVRDRA
ncbi:MAG: gamma carbonic anhydrase family protein [Tepidisphaeraceae bacterium]